MGGVLEGEGRAQKRRQHRRRRRRFGRMPRGVFGEGRGDQVGLPAGVDQPVDVGHRPQEVVCVLAVPAGDEAVGKRNAEAGEDLARAPVVDRVAVDDLQRDRDPVPGRGGRQHRIVRPEAGDELLLLGQGAADLPNLDRLGMEGRARHLAVGGGRRQGAGAARRHGEGPHVAPEGQKRRLLLDDQAGRHPAFRAAAGRPDERKAHVLDHRAAIGCGPGQDVGGDRAAVGKAAGGHLRRHALRQAGADPRRHRRHRPLPGRAGVGEEHRHRGRERAVQDERRVMRAGRPRRPLAKAVQLAGKRAAAGLAAGLRLPGGDAEIA